MSISAEARRIVEIFDRAEAFLIQMDNAVAGQPLLNMDSSWMEPLENVVELNHLKSEFQQFCREHEISGKLVTSETEWLNFIDKYASVIEDVPLVSSDLSLQYVKKVNTRRIAIPSGMNAAEVGKRYYLAVQWEWKSPNVLVQPEMDSGRAPLVSIASIPTGQFAPPKAWLPAEAPETATGFKKEIRLAGPIHHRARSALGIAIRGSEARLKQRLLRQWKTNWLRKESRICTRSGHFNMRRIL